MSNNAQNDVTDMPESGESRQLGIVKWFNNKAGFGFVTTLGGETHDVFVHHSGVSVGREQYKYLVQGEYVSFSLRESDNDDHPYQAGEVRGVLEGWLMCETRNANRSSREDGEEAEEEDSQRRRPRRQNRRVRPRGSGPRGSGEGGSDEWVLTRRSRGNGRRNQQNA